jgi:hypothetical protein
MYVGTEVNEANEESQDDFRCWRRCLLLGTRELPE